MNLPQVLWREEPTNELIKADDPRREIRTGSAIGFFFFVILLGWAAIAPARRRRTCARIDRGVGQPAGGPEPRGRDRRCDQRPRGTEGQGWRDTRRARLARPDRHRTRTDQRIFQPRRAARAIARRAQWPARFPGSRGIAQTCPIRTGCWPSRRCSFSAASCRRDPDPCRPSPRCLVSARSSWSNSAPVIPSSGSRCASSSVSPRKNWPG